MKAADRAASTQVGALGGLRPFLAPYRGLVAMAGAALVLTASISLLLPVAMRRVIDGFNSGAALLDSYFAGAMVIAGLLALGTGARPDPANFTPARAQTTTALRALTLSNNEFMLQQARHLTERAKTPERAFLLCFQRDPTPDELAAAKQIDLFSLCRMLLNANEFVYVD